MSGKFFIISGPSGVGKGTVLNDVMQRRSDLEFSVSATTRAPRPSEVDGVHYYFITHEKFEDMIRNNAFIEYNLHANACYGTPIKQLEEKLARSNVILDIEPKGAAIVHRQRPDAILLFIMPPSLEELEHRLRGRGDTSEEQIALRLERAKWEIEQRFWYDYVVVNDRLEDCVEEVLKIIAEKAD